MLAAQVRPIAAAGVVGVLNDVKRVVKAPCAEVDRVHRFRADHLRPLEVLVMADFIRVILEPRRVKPGFSLFHRANGVFPVPTGDEVAPRKADGGKAGFL